jgi:hypothetical protein
MLAWLADNASTFYVLLGIIALCLAALWWMNRKGYYLIALAVVVGLIALVIAISFSVVTDMQRIRSTILAMRDGVLEGKPEAVLKHFSRDFTVDAGDPKMFMEQAAQAIRRHRVTDIGLSSFDFEVPPDREKNAVVAFRTRVFGDLGDGFFLVRAEFVFENGEWRMKRIRLFNPVADTDRPIPIPLQ